jgi:hypothetical protein
MHEWHLVCCARSIPGMCRFGRNQTGEYKAKKAQNAATTNNVLMYLFPCITASFLSGCVLPMFR